MAREYISEAQAEQLHEEFYGVPMVTLAYPDRDSPEYVPDGALLKPGWYGQMMLSADPDQYRLDNLARIREEQSSHAVITATDDDRTRRTGR